MTFEQQAEAITSHIGIQRVEAHGDDAITSVQGAEPGS